MLIDNGSLGIEQVFERYSRVSARFSLEAVVFLRVFPAVLKPASRRKDFKKRPALAGNAGGGYATANFR